jgi:NADP-dependent 3-hydroxy acid dehydrogenase YdfG
MSEAPVALITGGGSGIGAAVARQLLDLGHRVTVTGRGAERLRAIRRPAGVDVNTVVVRPIGQPV